jgi:hypothetical protein
VNGVDQFLAGLQFAAERADDCFDARDGFVEGGPPARADMPSGYSSGDRVSSARRFSILMKRGPRSRGLGACANGAAKLLIES